MRHGLALGCVDEEGVVGLGDVLWCLRRVLIAAGRFQLSNCSSFMCLCKHLGNWG